MLASKKSEALRKTPKVKRESIQVTPEARKAFAEACDDRAVGRSMFVTASILLEWFSKQPPFVQTAVLSDIDRGMEEMYAQALERLAADVRAKAKGGK